MSVNKFGKQKYFIEDCDASELPTDPIIRDAFVKIWDKLKSTIFVWETFKTDLPFSVNTGDGMDKPGANTTDQHQNDLRAMCFDDNGKRKRLDKNQLVQIAKTGRFTVKSKIDERFDNVWLLGSLLQQGSEQIASRFKRRKKNAMRHWFLYLPEYFTTSGPYTIAGALKHAKNAFFHLFRIICGLPDYRPRYSDSRVETLINKARINYLLSGHIPDADNIYEWTDAEHKKLNILLADPDVINQLKEIIDQLKETLTNEGDNRDESLLQALIEAPAIAEVDPELPGLIKAFHNFCLQLSPLNPEYDVIYQAEIERIDQQLKEKYRFRGRYKSWRDKQLLLENEKILLKVNKQLTAELLSSLSGGQEACLLKRNMDFNEYESESIRGRLVSKMRLAKIFRLPVIQWSFRSLKKTERLPVINVKLTTQSACWRVAYFFTLTRILIHNTCLKLFRTLLHNPYGIKSIATMSKKKFDGEIWLLDTGKPYRAKKYGTYLTDIDETRQLIKKYRQQFEEKSDYGLFPRSIGRIFNLLFCYVVIGLMGGVFNFLFRVLAFSVVSVVAVLGVFLAPFWVPAFTLLVYLFNLFIYDYISPSPWYQSRKIKPYSAIMPFFNTLLNHMLIRGLLVAVVSFLGVIFHALIVPVIFLLSLLAYVLSHMWDTLMRFLFIYPFARIPGDDFAGVITRISGYGIASNVLHTVHVNDGLGKYQLWLQVFILDIYESVILKHLNVSQNLLSEMMDSPYRAIVGEKLYSVEDSLQDNIDKYEREFNEKVYAFRDSAYTEQRDYRAELIRLPRSELVEFLQDSQGLCQKNIEQDLFPWLSEAEKKLFWLNLGITENDWLLLNRVLLSQAFSADIFTPIEDCDENISVEVEPVNIAKSLLTEKQPVSKLNFTVSQHALFPETEKVLLFNDNYFWGELYSPLYLPLRWRGDWLYLLRLRDRLLGSVKPV